MAEEKGVYVFPHSVLCNIYADAWRRMHDRSLNEVVTPWPHERDTTYAARRMTIADEAMTLLLRDLSARWKYATLETSEPVLVESPMQVWVGHSAVWHKSLARTYAVVSEKSITNLLDTAVQSGNTPIMQRSIRKLYAALDNAMTWAGQRLDIVAAEVMQAAPTCPGPTGRADQEKALALGLDLIDEALETYDLRSTRGTPVVQIFNAVAGFLQALRPLATVGIPHPANPQEKLKLRLGGALLSQLDLMQPFDQKIPVIRAQSVAAVQLRELLVAVEHIEDAALPGGPISFAANAHLHRKLPLFVKTCAKGVRDNFKQRGQEALTPMFESLKEKMKLAIIRADGWVDDQMKPAPCHDGSSAFRLQ